MKKHGRSFSMDIANEELGFNCKFLTHIGSPMFSAPEINTLGFYSESIDIWGIGLINSFSKFGDTFFKREKKVKGTEDESDSSDEEEEEKKENDDKFVERIHDYI